MTFPARLVLLFLALSLSLVSSGCGSGSDLSNFNPTQAQAGTPSNSSQDPAAALAALQQGNARYVAGTNTVLIRSQDRPAELDNTQAPVAGILGCSDSRVLPDLAFDQGWGQLFTVRLAGNVADTMGVGSLEYAVTALGTRLLVVLGHEHCGAVKAAQTSPLPTGNLGALVQLIVPAAQAVVGQPGDPLENAILANIKLQAARLRSLSPVIDQAASSGQVVIWGALYHFDDGHVEFMKI